MKKHVIIFVCICFVSFVFAQEQPAKKKEEKKEAKSKFKHSDSFVFDLFSDMWKNVPDNTSSKFLNPGVNIYTMYTIPFGKSKVGFSFGIGLSAQNFKSNALIDVYDSVNVSYFMKITDGISYKKNKLTLAYIDVPLEIRFRTKDDGDKSFKIAAGFKVGYALNAHTKYKGDDMSGGDGKAKFKNNNIANIDPLRYGITGRIGYGKINLMGYYSLTNIFKSGKGPEMYPISVGLSIVP